MSVTPSWREEFWSDPGEPMTLAEFEYAPEDFRDELWRGVRVREPFPGARHARVARKLYLALASHLGGDPGDELLFDCGFLLAEEPPTLRRPDIALIARGRLPGELPAGFWRIAPDLAVEIVSPSNRVADMQQRVLDYLEAGTRQVWVIDPETRSALVHRSRTDIRLLTGNDELTALDLIPGFRLPLGALFT